MRVILRFLLAVAPSIREKVICFHPALGFRRLRGIIAIMLAKHSHEKWSHEMTGRRACQSLLCSFQRALIIARRHRSRGQNGSSEVGGSHQISVRRQRVLSRRAGAGRAAANARGAVDAVGRDRRRQSQHAGRSATAIAVARSQDLARFADGDRWPRTPVTLAAARHRPGDAASHSREIELITPRGLAGAL